MAIFQTEQDRQSYLQFLAAEAGRFEVEILAGGLMTNHVHFIAVPKRGDSLARAFGEAHRRYTRMRNFREGIRGYLFQGRFSSCVLDERHLLAAASYVELNPVRAGIVKKAWAYPWSSASFHTGWRKTDPLGSWGPPSTGFQTEDRMKRQNVVDGSVNEGVLKDLNLSYFPFLNVLEIKGLAVLDG